MSQILTDVYNYKLQNKLGLESNIHTEFWHENKKSNKNQVHKIIVLKYVPVQVMDTGRLLELYTASVYISYMNIPYRDSLVYIQNVIMCYPAAPMR
jgi:hypothetical protein